MILQRFLSNWVVNTLFLFKYMLHNSRRNGSMYIQGEKKNLSKFLTYVIPLRLMGTLCA